MTAATRNQFKVGPSEVFVFGRVPVKIDLADHVWPPTSHGRILAQAMAEHGHVICGQSVLDVGTGCGIHGILALKLGARSVDVTELDPDVLENATHNAHLNGVDFRHTLARDWLNFEPFELYDVVISNPPFFNVSHTPRRHFIDALLEQSGEMLRPGGRLLLIHSSMANFSTTESKLAQEGFLFSVVKSYSGPFRTEYFEQPGFLDEAEQVEGGFEVIDGIHVETLQVYLCTKRSRHGYLTTKTKPR